MRLRNRSEPAQAMMPAVVALVLLLWAASYSGAEPPLTPEQRALVKQAETSRIQAIAKVYGTVVSIFSGDRQGGGSGVLFDPAGLALTNHHVVEGAGFEGWAGLADGQLYRWRTLGTDPGGDIALIQIERAKAFPFASLGDSNRVQVGDWAMAMGNPFLLAEDYHPTVTLGIVSGIERFQPGGGKNQLIYGNCIQVDSSINPGNSGGPLFNMLGQVIGINGRGSFKERGRVNVGLGYAVSTRQIRNFIPDLLATKIAQHGTIDALFTNRGGHVICSTIEYDTPAAREGLQLGDELISFDDEPIVDANQFTNLITTLPAGWPVRLVCRRAGREYSISVRLSPLPYTLTAPEKPKDEPGKPAERPHVKTSAGPSAEPARGITPVAVAGGTAAPKSPPKPGEPPRVKQVKKSNPAWDLAKAGEIRDVKLNEANTARLLAHWARGNGVDQLPTSVQAFRLDDRILDGDRAIGKASLLVSRDGRLRVDDTIAGSSIAAGFDGKQFWHAEAGHAAAPWSLREATGNPLCLQALMVAACVNPTSLAQLGKITIDGGDRVGTLPAYRLRIEAADGDTLFLWLSIEVNGDLQQHQLLAAGKQIDPDGRGAYLTFSDYRPCSGVNLPRSVALAPDKAGPKISTLVVDRCQSETSVPPDSFQRSGHAGQ